MKLYKKNVCRISLLLLTGLVFVQCRQEMPVTSSISIDTESTPVEANQNLYGISLEEINHAIDGGLYAELIQNRSFEDGVIPSNCRFDAVRKRLITPNGFSLPFCGEDSIVGWRAFSAGSRISPDRQELINDKNKRSLFVSVFSTATYGRGGVVAEGYKGIPLQKNQKYELSLFVKNAYPVDGTIRIGLEDPETNQLVSDSWRISPSMEWRRLHHTFTALDDISNAILTITADTTAAFWIDVVSLFPQKTWKNRKNGLRPDLADLVANLSPRFVRFPGGDFVEGYSAGTYPCWNETIGDISQRKHFWSVWMYGTTNGFGFHEYLQFCEDIGAEPVFVVNSGITSQSRRPRYEDITKMDVLVNSTLDAIAYANAPVDSAGGVLRAQNGHPEPFHLKYIEIGNSNYGPEYIKRCQLFRKAIKEKYPEMTVITNEYYAKNRTDWIDRHFFADEDFFVSHSNMYAHETGQRKSPPFVVGSFSALCRQDTGALSKAIAEACFMIGMERYPDVIQRAAYAPVLTHVNYINREEGMILFDNHRTVATPSYHVMKMFSENRGDLLLKTEVSSYLKPNVTFGRAGFYMFDNAYEIKNVSLNGRTDYSTEVMDGGWTILPGGDFVPAPNQWNYIVFGDSAAHDYVLTARVRRTKGSGQMYIHLRDNALTDIKQNHISLSLGMEKSELKYVSGETHEILSKRDSMFLGMNTWYDVKVECKDENLKCYVNGKLVHDVKTRPLPSLVAVASRDTTNRNLILKVVNTTYRIEKTNIYVSGTSIANKMEIVQLQGQPDDCNNFEYPEKIVPLYKTVTSLGLGPITYEFPPHSISIIKWKMD